MSDARRRRLLAAAKNMSDEERRQWVRDIAREHGSTSDNLRLVREVVAEANRRDAELEVEADRCREDAEEGSEER